jgi:catechol 2,3-dioxygenase-like lactoylglutathione lyase family enzyme
MVHDIGLTHVAFPVHNIERSIAFYAKYARMQVVHRRGDARSGMRVAWLSDKTRAFVVVLLEVEQVEQRPSPFAHLGVGCESRQAVDSLCELARIDGCLSKEPLDSGYPVGYWALISDPDGHTLEVSYGQQVGVTVEQAT